MPLRAPGKATIQAIEITIATVDRFPMLAQVIANLPDRPGDALPFEKETDPNLIVLRRIDLESLLVEAGRPASGGSIIP